MSFAVQVVVIKEENLVSSRFLFINILNAENTPSVYPQLTCTLKYVYKEEESVQLAWTLHRSNDSNKYQWAEVTVYKVISQLIAKPLSPGL